MTNPGGSPPTLADRVVVGLLAVAALAVGAFWLWATAQGGLVAGVPSWVIGLVVVALIFSLALAVSRVRDHDTTLR